MCSQTNKPYTIKQKNTYWVHFFLERLSILRISADEVKALFDFPGAGENTGVDGRRRVFSNTSKAFDK